VGSSVHVAVRDAVDVFAHASIAINLLVCERLQADVLAIAASVNDTVGVPHASVAVAVPSAPSIVAAEGLHPRASGLPLVVIVGAVTSAVHVTVRDAVDVLLHASLTVHVRVCERPQLEL
jgi:hypothetical protein